jgi:peptidoglycan/LPS O-acetylase OafA/YrhL
VRVPSAEHLASDTTAAGPEPSHRNGFGLLRLVLASSVILQHSLALTGHIDDTFIGWWRPASIGDLAVSGFFAVSGYLLFASARRNSPRQYLSLRFHRLFPGYWASLVVVAFVAAPVAALLGAGTYQLLGTQSAMTFVVMNSTLVVLQHGIGDLLASNPWPLALNGSLWSLAPEFCCYLILLVTVLLGRRGKVSVDVWLGTVLVGCVTVMTLNRLFLHTGIGDALGLLAGLGLAFFTGSLVQHRGWLQRPSTRTTLLALLAVAGVVAVGLWAPVGPIVLAVALIAVGRRLTTGWASRVDEHRDVSYGVYLYHFPVIQLLVAAGVVPLTVVGALTVLAPATFVLVLPLAAASWYVVEKPAQDRARRLRRAAAARESGAAEPV